MTRKPHTLQVASELAYKAAAAEKRELETRVKHDHLQENHGKMQAKYRALKDHVKANSTQDATELAQVREKAAKWKAKAKELLDRFELQGREAKHVSDELIDTCAALAVTHEELQNARAQAKESLKQHHATTQELDKIKSEIPRVQSSLNELKQLKRQAEVHATTKTELANARIELAIIRQRLEAQATAHKQQLEALKAQLATATETKAELDRIKAELPHVNQLLREGRQARAAKDSAAAALKALSARAMACRDMMVSTEVVLRTCADLHTKQNPASSLSKALAETVATVAHFLSTTKTSDLMPPPPA